MRIYLDTNIYLDWLECRTDRLRPLGEFAFQIIRRTLECEFEIIISDVVLFELKRHTKMNEVMDLINKLSKKNKIIKIEKSEEDRSEAQRISPETGIHWQDVAHALLAKKADAECLITRDAHLFDLNLLQTKFPENI